MGVNCLVRMRVGRSERELEDVLLNSFFSFVQGRDGSLRDMIRDVLIRAPHRSPADRAAQILSEFMTESEKTGEPLYLDDSPYETYLSKKRFIPDTSNHGQSG